MDPQQWVDPPRACTPSPSFKSFEPIAKTCCLGGPPITMYIAINEVRALL